MISCSCLQYAPVNKTLFYDGINSKLFNRYRNIYKQRGTSTLQIKDGCLLLSQRARILTNRLENGLQQTQVCKHAATTVKTYLINSFVVNLHFSMDFMSIYCRYKCIVCKANRTSDTTPVKFIVHNMH
jgi:hypothetical protein